MSNVLQLRHLKIQRSYKNRPDDNIFCYRKLLEKKERFIRILVEKDQRSEKLLVVE